ncbi:MAG TPA: DUF3857 domain-containing transglutaminase family protein [Ohtaekwangia sp.]
MKLLFFFSALAVLITGFSKEEPKYPVSQIPDSLKAGMYAVIRVQEQRVAVNSVKNSTFYFHKVITILNSKGADLAKEVVGYDKLMSVKYLKGTVYDAEGNVTRKLKQSEIIDQSAFDGSMFSDNRIKVADLSQGIYPYTVEFEYELEDKKLYDLPDFELYDDDEVSIQESVFRINYVEGLKPRYKLFKVQEPITGSENGLNTLQWSFKNIIPDKFEILSPDSRQVVPNIRVAPNKFEYEGYAGSMQSWSEYGQWQRLLNDGRDVLPENTKLKVRELTKNATSVEERTKVLYEYLQSRTRYVNIALGIGGLQPFPASMVDQTGYGDCKGLSNYMVAMLKEAGVKGYYTKINAGTSASEIDETFPSHQTNHIIVSVPNGADTIWLECTSQTNPFDYLGSFTGDRKAFMVTESGGKIVNTHRYTSDQNLQSRMADVYLDVKGNAKATIKTVYSGLRYEHDNLEFVLNKQYDDQKKWIQRNTAIPSFDISSFQMVDKRNRIPSAEVNTELVLNRLASVSGKRLFIMPNLMNRLSHIPEKMDKRKTNVVLHAVYTDIDTIRFHIPQDIYPEFLPSAVSIKSTFGEYECNYIIDQGSLVYVRRLKFNKGEFPPEMYNKLVDFCKSINKADNTKVVFLSKT